MVRTRTEIPPSAARPRGWLRRVHAALAVATAVSAAAVAAPAAAFTVFACEPEWAALARALLPQARVHVATTAKQDPHHIEARPALIAQLRGADLAACTGASLEAGWLPTLQQRAGNPRVQDGAPGMFYAADHVILIDVPQRGAAALATPFAGDVHAEGNPHLHADPRRLLEAARALAAQVQALQPAQAGAVGERLARLESRLQARIGDWERRAAPLRGRAVAVQHGSLAYLWRWLGLVPVADLEPVPGMAPTPGHLQRVLQALRPKPPLAIVVARHQDPRPGRWLAAQLGGSVPLLVLPATVPDDSAPDAIEDWFEQMLQALLKAAGG
jgi:zinc/manganese transport system substrate-binding protein